jgi:hypothetical protein
VTAGRMGLLLCAGVSCVSWLAMAGGTSQAGAFTASLEYTAETGCPDVADFKAIVAARLAYDPFDDRATNHVLVRIALGDGSLDGRIEWRDSSGRWVGDQSFPLASTDCLRLARTIGFALAVQIQLLARTSAEEAETAAPRETGPPAASPARPNTPLPQATTISNTPGAQAASLTPRPWPLFAIGAGPSVGFGMSSAPIVLGRLLGTLAWRHVSLELAAELSLPSTTRRADGAGFSQQHLLASAAGCAVLTRWKACLVAVAGEVRMTGEDIDRPTSAEVPVVEAGARVGFVQRLGHGVFLDAHADGLAILTRWTATLDQVSVWTAPRFAAVLGVDASVRFR